MTVNDKYREIIFEFILGILKKATNPKQQQPTRKTKKAAKLL